MVDQFVGAYECRDDLTQIYHEECIQLLKEFKLVRIEHIPKDWNEDANQLAQDTFGYWPICEEMVLEVLDGDWRKEIIEYMKDLSKKVDRRIRFQLVKYVLLEEDLYHPTIDGVLLKCIGEEEAKVLMGEIHGGVCGAHQSAFKMKWVIRRNGYFWTTILEDCFRYYKGCQYCQRFGNVQRVPTSAMNPIIKAWPFRGWRIDLIGQIYPSSSKGYKFTLVRTHYVTKWVEAIPLKVVTSMNMIDFVK